MVLLCLLELYLPACLGQSLELTVFRVFAPSQSGDFASQVERQRSLPRCRYALMFTPVRTCLFNCPVALRRAVVDGAVK